MSSIQIELDEGEESFRQTTSPFVSRMKSNITNQQEEIKEEEEYLH